MSPVTKVLASESKPAAAEAPEGAEPGSVELSWWTWIGGLWSARLAGFATLSGLFSLAYLALLRAFKGLLKGFKGIFGDLFRKFRPEN